MLDLNELEQLIAFADTGTLSKVVRSIPYFHPISHPFYENIEEEFGVSCFTGPKIELS